MSCEAAECQRFWLPTVTLPGLAPVGEVISAVTGEKNNMMCNFPRFNRIQNVPGTISSIFHPSLYIPDHISLFNEVINNYRNYNKVDHLHRLCLACSLVEFSCDSD